MAAGVVMALWSMAAMWVTGSGFWTPMNLIANTFYRSAPLDGTFSASALVIGLAVHMTVASFFGTLIALFAQRMPGARSLVISGGILLIAVVWPVMQWGIWYKLDEAAAEGYTDWIMAVAHLMFGVTAAGFAALAVTDDEGARGGRHAVGYTPPVSQAPGSLFQPQRRMESQDPRPRY
jgi:hypothetical protein